jgi:hypothetical protein
VVVRCFPARCDSALRWYSPVSRGAGSPWVKGSVAQHDCGRPPGPPGQADPQQRPLGTWAWVWLLRPVWGSGRVGRRRRRHQNVFTRHPGQPPASLPHLRNIHVSRFGCRRRRWIIVGDRRRGTDQAADGGRRSECCTQASCAIYGCLESVDDAPIVTPTWTARY